MAMAMGHTSVEIEDIGHSVTVPDDPLARLMYYFNCVLSLIDDDDDDFDTIAIRRLRDYTNYRRLSDSEKDTLVYKCSTITPSKLLASNMFEIDEDLEKANAFYKIRASSIQMMATPGLRLRHQRVQVTEKMACTKDWLDRYYYKPMEYFRVRLNRIRRQNSAIVIYVDDCVVM